MQQIQAIKRPTERAQNNLYNLASNTQSLVDDELTWIRRGPDLAAVGCGPEYGWFNTFLEDALNNVSKVVTLVSDPVFYLPDLHFVERNSSSVLTTMSSTYSRPPNRRQSRARKTYNYCQPNASTSSHESFSLS